MQEKYKGIALVTGGAGFIGSALARWIHANTDFKVIVLDALTYAGDRKTLASLEGSDQFEFIHANINNPVLMMETIAQKKPDVIFHLAAESHVDNSIIGPDVFIQTNVVGTYNMLEAARSYWSSLEDPVAEKFRFIHISTDEVFGSLGAEGLFSETTPYDPSSPYSASKAASDHLARAWNRTYGLPIMITNCSNNYGPYQFPEKLIPLMILNALKGEDLPVYGDGSNVRDWLYVEDHCRGLWDVYSKAKPGSSYNFGGDSQKNNLEVVETICDLVDEKIKPENSSKKLIKFVKDRPGHDFRYAMDSSKAKRELGWKPSLDFDGGLERTIDWYLQNKNWWSQSSN